MNNKLTVRTHVSRSNDFKFPTWRGSISVWENGRRSWGEFSKITRLTPTEAMTDAINLKNSLLESWGVVKIKYIVAE